MPNSLSISNMSDLHILYEDFFNEQSSFDELIEITGSERSALEFLLIKELEQLAEV